jgi:predicted PhzF superfamily epimerase YddE/YHI9
VPRMTMYQVDAFTTQVFGGNPAAVLVTDTALPDAAMQDIAAENNLAETAFVVPTGGVWSIRWFTPLSEAAFCGHATLASAHVIASEMGAGNDMTFRTRKVGDLRVRALGGARYEMDFPAIAPEPLAALPPGVAAQFGDRIAGQFRNFENLFAVLRDADDVAGHVPDFGPMTGLGVQGLCITAAGGTDGSGMPVDFVSRYFAPGVGIPEDPVTGSIHATLVPYWAGRTGKTRLLAWQASRRGGALDCTMAGERVMIAGSAVTYLRGEIEVP